MKELTAMIKRNVKLFFKDKTIFLVSLITPVILLVLYATFLANVYRESFSSSLPQGFEVSERLIDGCVGGQLISSILAVSCVTVAFCSNLIMVQDKARGTYKDLMLTPVKKSTLALGYYLSTLISTLLVCLAAMVVCLIYVACVGWYIRFLDILLLLLDMFLLVMFGTALSSIVNCFLGSEGQMSAVGTIVSSGYGFLCGAYMPISQFGSGLQKVLSFFPGTYGTSLLRNHALAGVFEEMNAVGFPTEVVDGIKDSIDCNLYFFGHQVSIGAMYAIISLTVVALMGIYIAVHKRKSRKN